MCSFDGSQSVEQEYVVTRPHNQIQDHHKTSGFKKWPFLYSETDFHYIKYPTLDLREVLS